MLSPASSEPRGSVGAFAHLTIRAKMTVSAVCLLTILAGLSGGSVAVLARIDGQVSAFAGRVDGVMLAQDIDRGVLDLRRLVREFVLTGAEPIANAAQAAAVALRQRLSDAGLTAAEADGVQGHLAAYGKAVADLTEGKREQVRMIREVLDPSGAMMLERFQDIRAAAARDGDAEGLRLAGEGTERLLFAWLNTTRTLSWVDLGKAEAAVAAERRFGELIGALDALVEKAKGREYYGLPGKSARWRAAITTPSNARWRSTASWARWSRRKRRRGKPWWPTPPPCATAACGRSARSPPTPKG